MKILMLSEFYPPIAGGMGRYVQSVSRELVKRGHEVKVCTTAQQDLPKYEEEDGVKILRIPGFFQRIPFLFKDPAKRYHPPTYDWSIAKQLRRVIEEQRPSVIHAHGWMLYSILPWEKDFKIPLLVTLVDCEFICPKRSLLSNTNVLCDEPFTKNCIACGRDSYSLVKALAAYYGVKTNKKKLKSVDKFIAISSFTKQINAKHLGLSDNDIVMIPPFYDPDIDRQEEKAVDLPEDFILFVGALAPYKGTEVLAEAHQKLNTQTKLLLMGYSHPDYHYESREGVMVVENAPRSVVMQAMSRCRFAVFPSMWAEGFGIVAIEAMSRKKAVIASDIGGLKDVVVDQQTGILVPPNDLDKLADAISHLLERPELASEMGARGYERFMKHYTPDAVIPRIVDLYESLKKEEAEVEGFGYH